MCAIRNEEARLTEKMATIRELSTAKNFVELEGEDEALIGFDTDDRLVYDEGKLKKQYDDVPDEVLLIRVGQYTDKSPVDKLDSAMIGVARDGKTVYDYDALIECYV